MTPTVRFEKLNEVPELATALAEAVNKTTGETKKKLNDLLYRNEGRDKIIKADAAAKELKELYEKVTDTRNAQRIEQMSFFVRNELRSLFQQMGTVEVGRAGGGPEEKYKLDATQTEKMVNVFSERRENPDPAPREPAREPARERPRTTDPAPAADEGTAPTEDAPRVNTDLGTEGGHGRHGTGHERPRSGPTSLDRIVENRTAQIASATALGTGVALPYFASAPAWMSPYVVNAANWLMATPIGSAAATAGGWAMNGISNVGGFFEVARWASPALVPWVGGAITVLGVLPLASYLKDTYLGFIGRPQPSRSYLGRIGDGLLSPIRAVTGTASRVVEAVTNIGSAPSWINNNVITPRGAGYGAAGAFMGSMLGGPVGAGIGGVAGLIAGRMANAYYTGEGGHGGGTAAPHL